MKQIPFCKNAVLYSYNPEVTAEQIIVAMESRPFTECRPESLLSSGFVKEDDKPVVRAVDGILRFRFRRDDKLLPNSVVNAEVNRQIKMIEEDEGVGSVPRSRRAEIKEAVFLDMVKKAFVQSHYMQGLVDTKNHVIMIDTSSYAKADLLTTALLNGFSNNFAGKLGMRKWEVSTSPAYFMTVWASTGEAPEGFSIDDCAVFEDAMGGKVRVAGKSLYNETLQQLAGQAACKELAMTHEDEISFQLCENMVIKRIRFVGIRSIDENQGDMLEEERGDAEILLMSSLIWKAASAMTEIFGGNPNVETRP